MGFSPDDYKRYKVTLPDYSSVVFFSTNTKRADVEKMVYQWTLLTASYAHDAASLCQYINDVSVTHKAMTVNQYSKLCKNLVLSH